MSDYDKLKLTPEYRAAKKEFEAIIERKLKPFQLKLSEVGEALIALEKKVATLEDRLQKP
ncbi:MAG: hypothetical protein ACLQIQ_08590 [Beijerinckiaceae bacterium]